MKRQNPYFRAGRRPYLLHITGTADVYLLPRHLASQHPFLSVMKGEPGLQLALGFAYFICMKFPYCDIVK